MVLDTGLTLFIVFCAGCFAAAIGSLNAVILTAAVVALGIVSGMAGLDANYNIIGNVGFGLILGPHISFGAAACAAGYAKWKGYMENPSDIVTPLISLYKPDAIVAGGVFALLAYYVNIGLGKAGFAFDTVAATIVLTACFAKIIFSKDQGPAKLFGVVPDAAHAAGGRWSVLNKTIWFAHQARGSTLVLIGLVIGALSGLMTLGLMYASLTPGAAALANIALFPGWAIGIVSFTFLLTGAAIPVTHHIAILSSYVIVAIFNSMQKAHVVASGITLKADATSGDVLAALQGNEVALKAFQTAVSGHFNTLILWGVALGILGAFLASYWGRAVTSYGDTFIDPPSAAIAIGSILPLTICPAINAYDPSSGLYLGLPIAIIIVGVIIAFVNFQTLARAEGKAS